MNFIKYCFIFIISIQLALSEKQKNKINDYITNAKHLNNVRNLIKFQFNYLFWLFQSDNPKPMELTFDMIEVIKKLRSNFKKLNEYIDTQIMNEIELDNIEAHNELTKNYQ